VIPGVHGVELTAASIRRRMLLAPLAEHKGRSLLSIIAIALGVALGYAVQLINQVAVSEFSQAVQALSGQADLEVRGPRSGFDEALYPVVAQMPEVAVASPVLELDVRIVDRREPLKLMAVDVFRAAQVQPELVLADAGEPLDFLRADRIFLSRPAAEWLKVGAGDEIGVQVGLSEVRLRVAGIVRGESLRQRLGVVDIGGAQWRLERLGQINRIDLRLRPGADIDAFAARVQSQLPPGLVIERPEANVARSASMSRAYRINLNVLALVALFTGGLLVFSTQALAVVQRRAQIGLLRVLGMTGRQIRSGLLREALVVGAIGALAGIALGHLGAELVIRHLGADLGAGQFHGLRPEVRMDPLGLLLFAMLGIATAVAGSLVPALEAVRASAAQALKAGDEQRMFERLQPVLPGALVLLGAAALTQGPPVRELPFFGYAAIACFLIGTIMLMPRLASVFFRGLPRLPRGPARLAVAQLAGAPGQAMVSLAAIVASVSLMVSMAIMVTSFRISLDAWLEHLLPADLYMRTGLQNETAFLSPENQARIRAAPGVRRVEFLRTQQLLLAPGRPRVLLLARTIDRGEPGATIPLVGPHIVPKPGDPPPVWASEAVADLYGYRAGATVELPLGGRVERFLVAGIWRDYARQQGSIVMEREVYVDLTGDRNVNDGAVWFAPGALAAPVREAIRAALPGGLNLELGEPGQIRDSTLRIFDRTFAVTYGLEAVAVVIGLFGLSSSFGALVLARRREFGTLRHIGMTRRQIGGMLAVEGALVSSLGLATGIALGWLISMVLIHVVNRQSFHWSMELHLPWGTLGAFAAAMLGLAVLTALASGRRAMGDEAVRAVKEDW
jgi:putative ABC transport system permease protein